jgi:hypothetical protein
MKKYEINQISEKEKGKEIKKRERNFVVSSTDLP